MHQKIIPMFLAGLFMLFAAGAHAQIDENSSLNYAMGFGVGLNRAESQGVLHFTGNFRFNWWDEADEDLERALVSRGRSRIRGFVEAEVGYWKESDLSPFDSDFSIGVNAVAVYPTRHVDLFFGGGVGAHFLSESVSGKEEESQGDQTRFGANMQFGVDLNFTEPVGFFALGRYDILQGENFDFQSKILIGIRYRF